VSNDLTTLTIRSIVRQMAPLCEKFAFFYFLVYLLSVAERICHQRWRHGLLPS